MALHAIAVLTYDKRGVGQSGGSYQRTDDISAANLALLASDAAAAMQWVSNSSRVRSLPGGFVAISQSGWVVPMALAKSPAVDFIGFWSGPTCTTSEQLQFQHFSAEHESDRSRMTDSEISVAMRHVDYRPDDIDPLSQLTAVSIPGLWLFGGQDPYLPIELSTRRLQKLIDNGRSNFEYRVFTEEGHNLADSPKQASFIAMIDWIERIAASRR
ncbi:MAG: alpha/beta hydrolase [Hydrocarboniphaga sp.]|nr:alpha/beta hydrolase [Hydrocarboniphaga sp.]